MSDRRAKATAYAQKRRAEAKGGVVGAVKIDPQVEIGPVRIEPQGVGEGYFSPDAYAKRNGGLEPGLKDDPVGNARRNLAVLQSIVR